MKPFADRLREDQRLVLLRTLVDMPGYTANSSVLYMEMHGLGHRVSRDLIKTHMHWLGEQDLVMLEEAVEGVLVATLTERGGDVAAGVAVVPGVKRPGA